MEGGLGSAVPIQKTVQLPPKPQKVVYRADQRHLLRAGRIAYQLEGQARLGVGNVRARQFHYQPESLRPQALRHLLRSMGNDIEGTLWQGPDLSLIHISEP